MASIIEFLEARIAEDEAAAREADDITARYFGSTDALLHSKLDVEDPGHDNPWFVVIDTTRVLAECAAKRAIIEAHTEAGPVCMPCEHEWPCATIRAVASVYSDRPDYQQEWAV